MAIAARDPSAVYNLFIAPGGKMCYTCTADRPVGRENTAFRFITQRGNDMPKFSVKKPFTVLVAVILVIVLGFVSLSGMQTDLLPNMNLPYLMVVTTYPGASPEQVEGEVTKPIEDSLATLNGVKNVTSQSNENYSLVTLEYEDKTNMDSAMVKASTALNQLGDALPGVCSTPMLIEMSPDMLATQYIAVSRDDMDIYELSDYVENTLLPKLGRVDGVARISTTGLVKKTVEITLNQDKIDAVNDKLLVQVSDRLADAKAELDKSQAQLNTTKKQLEDAQKQVQAGKQQLTVQKDSVTAQLKDAIQKIDEQLPEVTGQVAELGNQLQELQRQLDNLKMDADRLPGIGVPMNEELYAKGLAVVAEYAPQYTADTRPDTWEQAKADAAKRAALQADCSDAAAALRSAIEKDNGTNLPALNEKQLYLTALSAALTLEQQQQDTAAAITDLNAKIDELNAQLQALNDQRAQLQATLEGLTQNPLDPSLGALASQLLFSGSEAQLGLGEYQITDGLTQLQAGQAQLDAARKQYESAREEALKNANLDQLLNITTLSQLIMAQNFSMPAGYIDDTDGNSYVLKVGTPYDSVDALGDMVLCAVPGVGDVQLQDVADVRLTDNADASYAKVGENRAVLLSVYKGSTASTSAVSKAMNAEMTALEADNSALHLTAIMDQGDYIKLIVRSVLSNLIEGAILAVIVLAFFLKDLRPTLVVAISMPLSVLFAIVLMYFSGITLNILSLSGLALGVGMLVDNSVVVIENIYRLRNRGLPAARAAVQGARQVQGSIISSTLTTVCVFLPLVFSSGMVMELMDDMAWTITFSLLASLVVALTVVPCAGSTVLKKPKDIRHPLFDRMLNGYEKLLRFCLRRKAVPLALAVVLLGVSVWRVATMGIVLIPEMSSNQLSMSLTLPADTPDADCFAAADAAMAAVCGVDGVETVGAMSGGSNSMAATVGLGADTAANNTEMTFYILLTDEGAAHGDRVQQDILQRTADLNGEVSLNANGMMDMSALSGSGAEVDIYGNDLDDLRTAADAVKTVMAEIPGVEDISDGQDAGDEEVLLTIDKDKAMRSGLTVAQIYQKIAAALSTDATATTLTVENETYTVKVINAADVPTLNALFDLELTATAMDDSGQQVQTTYTLGEFATRSVRPGYTTITRENGARKMTVTASTAAGYNTTLITRELAPKLAALTLPAGCTTEIAGESSQVSDMLAQMAKMLALALAFVYFVMVAQFQSLLSPFIVLFTIPLAFTGGMLGLMAFGEQLSVISLMGFLVLMGVVVNNGIVFVDYANQLRIGGLQRQDALVATGRTRMRPILMTTLTTVLAMVTMLLSTDAGSEMGKGMAIVIIGGLAYATLMTLFIVPVLYDSFYRKPPVNVDVGDEGLDDLPDDAAEFAAEFAARRAAEPQPQDPEKEENEL